MMDLLVAGGLLFTVPLTILAVGVVVIAIRAGLSIRTQRETASFWSTLLFHVGLFALMLGILSQAIGLYQMMSVIEEVGGASPAIVMGGLKVSMIAPLFGLVIFLTAMLCRIALDLWQRGGAAAA